MLVGTGVTLYGANKQSKDNKAAINQNQQSFDTQQLANWNSYLMQRGVNPAGNTTVGGFGSGQPINSRLPIWAHVRRSATPGSRPKLVARSPNAGMGITDQPQITSSPQPTNSGSSNRMLSALDPLGLVTGKKPTVKSILDPFDFF